LKYTLPRHFTRLNLSDQLEWKYVSWPQPLEGTRLLDAANERALTYSSDVSTALDLPVSVKMDTLVRRIANFRKPVAFCSTIYGEHWQPEEPALIRMVLEFWSKIPSLPNNQPMIAFFVIALHHAVESLLSRWFVRRQSPKISSILDAIREARGIDLDVVVLPELADVTVPDIEHWVREIVRPMDPEGMIRQIKRSFKEYRLASDQPVAMEKLVPILKAVLPASQRLRGT
jgi:hypothetical protein